MTIAERIKLHGLGYTKDEINQMIESEKAEQKPAEVPEQKPAEVPQKIGASQFYTAITELTKTLQANAIQQSAQPDSKEEQTADDILNQILGGELK